MSQTEERIFPARLRVISSTGSPHAVILRRGPSRQVLSIGWNREKDTFTLGQWLKGIIYWGELSPDGSHWIYGAAKGGESWTAVARVPWLKAVDFYRHSQGYSWRGGGVFLSNREYWLFTAPEPFAEIRKTSRYNVTQGRGSELAGLGVASHWERDGWKPCKDPLLKEERKPGYRKRILDNWCLHVSFRLQGGWSREMGKGYCYNHYFLRDKGTGETIHKDWGWADFDGRRLLFAHKGRLLAGKINKQGAVWAKELLDTNPLVFTQRQAPY